MLYCRVAAPLEDRLCNPIAGAALQWDTHHFEIHITLLPVLLPQIHRSCLRGLGPHIVLARPFGVEPAKSRTLIPRAMYVTMQTQRGDDTN